MTFWRWVEALGKLPTNSPLLLENCGDNHATWSPPDISTIRGNGHCGFQMYRISADIAPQFYSTMYNLQAMLPYTNYSRPGCWCVFVNGSAARRATPHQSSKQSVYILFQYYSMSFWTLPRHNYTCVPGPTRTCWWSGARSCRQTRPGVKLVQMKPTHKHTNIKWIWYNACCVHKGHILRHGAYRQVPWFSATTWPIQTACPEPSLWRPTKWPCKSIRSDTHP